MGLIGCSPFLHSALSQSLSSSTYCSPFLFPFHRKTKRKKSEPTIASFWDGGRPADEGHLFHRRVVLLVGVSVLPFLQFSESAAGKPEEAIGAVCHAAGFANILLYQRNRSKKAKDRSNKVLDSSSFEEKMAMGIQESRGAELKESEIDSLDSIVLGNEVGIQEGREIKFETKDEGLGAAKKDFEAQHPEINEPEIPSLQPMNSYGEAQKTSGRGSFVSFLNGIGIIGSGVLGALFAASRMEKIALESTIDSMKTQTKDQEIAKALLKKNFEARLLSEHEEHQGQLRRFKDEEASLSSELNSAKDAVTALGRELQDEKRLAVELNAQRLQLENSFAQAREDKKLLEAAFHEKTNRVTALQEKLSRLSSEINERDKVVQNLKSLLSERESECKSLSYNLEQAREEIAAANSKMEQLEKEILKTIEECNSKGSIIDDLQAKVEALTEEKDDSNSKFSNLMKDYDDMISYSERTAVHNSELLSEKNEQLQKLEENLKHASSEVSCMQAIISELTRERDNMRALLEKEKSEIYILTGEIQRARGLLATSKAEVSDISKELMEAKAAYAEVMSKILEMEDEYDRARQLLDSNLEEAKATSKILSDKLESAMVVLGSTEEELASTSNELKTVIEEREGLKKELVDTYKRVETTTNLLKEERKIADELNKELEVLRDQIVKDSEARRGLEADLDEATRSLDEMNRSALLLSRELENTNSRNSSLETEKEILYNSLVQQKNMAKEAHENIDDAKQFITRLGSEREKLEKRTKRFEEELAAAKGEILRLRRKLGVGQESMTELLPKSNEVPAGTPFTVKKNTGRRKKRPPGSDDSL